MNRPMLKDLIVKDPLPTRIRAFMAEAVCAITHKHKPVQKMHCTVCKRCSVVLPRNYTTNRMSPYAKELLRDHGITVRDTSLEDHAPDA